MEVKPVRCKYGLTRLDEWWIGSWVRCLNTSFFISTIFDRNKRSFFIIGNDNNNNNNTAVKI